MQQPINTGRQYITTHWRDLQSCTDYQYTFLMSRRLRESERVELIHRLNATLKAFADKHDGLYGANT